MSYCMLMSETILALRDKFLKWKEDFECKGMKVNLGKTNVMVSSGITQDGLCESKVDSCMVCCLRVKANSVLCGRWIYILNAQVVLSVATIRLK